LAVDTRVLGPASSPRLRCSLPGMAVVVAPVSTRKVTTSGQHDFLEAVALQG
jgi:hypothetical protein